MELTSPYLNVEDRSFISHKLRTQFRLHKRQLVSPYRYIQNNRQKTGKYVLAVLMAEERGRQIAAPTVVSRDAAGSGVVYTVVQKGLRVYQGILHRKGDPPWEVGVTRLRKQRKPRKRNRGERNPARFASLASALYWLVRLILLLWDRLTR